MANQIKTGQNRVRDLFRVNCRIILVLIVLSTSPPLQAKTLTDRIRLSLEQQFSGTREKSPRIANTNLRGFREVERFYRQRDYHPAWFGNSGRLALAGQLVGVLSATSEEGLNPADYHLAEIRLLQKKQSGIPRPKTIAEEDLLLTDAFLSCASHFLYGRINPRTIDPGWAQVPKQGDLLDVLNRALTSGQIAENLEFLLPQNIKYLQLKMALMRYRSLSTIGGWPEIRIKGEIPLKPGMKTETGPNLRRRLLITGDLESGLVTDDRFLYDANLAKAVSRFQSRHGLKVDGRLGKNTLRVINVPVENKIRRLIINLERLRWMPRDLGNPRILVNIPEFKLSLIENSGIALESRVIVGQNKRQTPVFSGTMTFLIVNPNWYVPPAIFLHDLLPRLKKDPEYLENKGIHVYRGWERGPDDVLDPQMVNWDLYSEHRFPFVIRQAPGPHNELGVMKFMFPNRYNIYLHDTPHKNLFRLRDRAFSSGCIRIERYLDLADYLTREHPAWNRKRLLATIRSGDPIRINLQHPIPVHIVYRTAWVDSRNLIHFADDIYNRDKKLSKALGVLK